MRPHVGVAGTMIFLLDLNMLQIASRSKMMLTEYLVCLLTFVAIQITGIEVGMFVGVIFSIFSFVVSYAKLPSVSVTSQQSSNVVRTFEERAVLFANRGKIVTISLQGFIFFGSAVKILSDVKKHVVIATDADHPISAPSPDKSDQVKSADATVSYQHETSSPPMPIPAVHQMQSVYTMSGEEMLRHHEKWAQNCGEPRIAFSFSSSNSMLGRAPIVQNEETTGLLSDMIDIELSLSDQTVSRGDTYHPDVTDVLPHESNSTLSPIMSDCNLLQSLSENQSKLSVLSSVWSGQTEFRSQRKRSSSNLQSMKTFGNSGSRSVLQIQGIGEEHSPLLWSRDKDTNGTFAPAPKLSPQRTEFLILDFSAVRGLDATAARSCFLMLLQILRGSGATVVFAGLKSAVRDLLRAHGVIIPGDEVMCDLNDAIEWCEEQVLLR